MNPYAERVPLQAWWTLGLAVTVFVLLFALPPAIECVERVKNVVEAIGGRLP